MTGMYLRIRRNGEVQPVEIDRMDDDELDRWAKKARVEDPAKGYDWAFALAKWIRENVREPEPGSIIPAELIGRAAFVDRFVRMVHEGILAMPGTLSQEADIAFREVLVRAIKAIPEAQPGYRDSMLPGPGRDGH
jgi:hypothetical protein